MYESLTYDQPVVSNYEDLQAEHKKVLEWVGSHKKVLEIGCHTGYLSYWLKQRNNLVTGVDINPEAIARAAQHLQKAVLGDIQEKQTWAKLSEEKFDSILYLHVLEHLVDPWKVLEQSSTLLNPGGHIIIALPNICNFRTRWDIFRGRFEYTETGVLDNTHLRFFTPETARRLITGSGFTVGSYYSPWQTGVLAPFRFFWRFDQFSLRLLKNRPGLTDITMMFLVSPKQK